MTRGQSISLTSSATLLVVSLVACSGDRGAARPARTGAALTAARSVAVACANADNTCGAAPRAAAARARVQALVTAETENRLLVVDLPSGRVTERVALPTDPEYVAAAGPNVVTVSAGAGVVTLLASPSLRTIRSLGGFPGAYIPAISPDGKYAYVTDDSSGQLSVIRFSDARLLRRLSVGAGAHHMGFSPDERQVWIALGQAARTIAIVSTAAAGPSSVGDPARPRVIARFDPGFLAHDVQFTPDGQDVWVTSASGPDIGVFSARDHRLLFRVPGGPPPQHVVFDGRFAYVTSGYGSRIERAAIATGRVLKSVSAPYGSFELAAADGFVVTSSLFRGTLAIYDRQLDLRHVRRIASATEDVAILPPTG